MRRASCRSASVSGGGGETAAAAELVGRGGEENCFALAGGRGEGEGGDEEAGLVGAPKSAGKGMEMNAVPDLAANLSSSMDNEEGEGLESIPRAVPGPDAVAETGAEADAELAGSDSSSPDKLME